MIPDRLAVESCCQKRALRLLAGKAARCLLHAAGAARKDQGLALSMVIRFPVLNSVLVAMKETPAPALVRVPALDLALMAEVVVAPAQALALVAVEEVVVSPALVLVLAEAVAAEEAVAEVVPSAQALVRDAVVVVAQVWSGLRVC